MLEIQTAQSADLEPIIRLLRTQLYEIGPLDPISFAAAPAIALAVALAACAVPSWRASALDPAAAIRSE